MLPNRQQFNIRLLGGEYATAMNCREAKCEQSERGWVSVLDPINPDHAVMIDWLRRGRSGREFREYPSEEAAAYLPSGNDNITFPPGLVVFLFVPGQQCFRIHGDREVVFAHEKDGQRQVHARPRDWNEHFNDESYSVQRARERG